MRWQSRQHGGYFEWSNEFKKQNTKYEDPMEKDVARTHRINDSMLLNLIWT